MRYLASLILIFAVAALAGAQPPQAPPLRPRPAQVPQAPSLGARCTCGLDCPLNGGCGSSGACGIARCAAAGRNAADTTLTTTLTITTALPARRYPLPGYGSLQLAETLQPGTYIVRCERLIVAQANSIAACDCEQTRKCTCGAACVCAACKVKTACNCAVTRECTCAWPGCTCPACEAYRRPAAFIPFAPVPPAFTGGGVFVAPRFVRGAGGC